MKKLILLTLLGIAPLAYASPMSQSDIDQLIQKLQALHNDHPSLQANFREERHLTMLKDPVVNEGKVWFTLPDKIRREIGGKTPSTTVIDGKKMSIYYPNYQQLEIYDLEKRPIIKDSLRALTAGLNFREISSYYNVEGSKERQRVSDNLDPKDSIGKEAGEKRRSDPRRKSVARTRSGRRLQGPKVHDHLHECPP